MRALIVAIAIAASASPAWAQVFDPHEACVVRTEAIEFGLYDPHGPPKLSTAHVDARCNGPNAQLAPRIGISPGLSGNYLDRTLVSGGHVLHYNLYVDAGRRLVAGNGTNGTSPLVGRQKSGPGARSIFRVFAVIPSGQAVPAGEYSDIIQVTLEF